MLSRLARGIARFTVPYPASIIVVRYLLIAMLIFTPQKFGYDMHKCLHLCPLPPVLGCIQAYLSPTDGIKFSWLL